MKKLKVITHVANRKKTLRIQLPLKEKIIKSIDEMLMKVGEDFSYFEYCNHKTGICDYSHKPKDLKNETISFFDDEESGFIIIKENTIDIILLKNSRLFKKLEKNVFSIFDFVKPKPLKVKKKTKE